MPGFQGEVRRRGLGSGGQLVRVRALELLSKLQRLMPESAAFENPEPAGSSLRKDCVEKVYVSGVRTNGRASVLDISSGAPFQSARHSYFFVRPRLTEDTASARHAVLDANNKLAVTLTASW